MAKFYLNTSIVDNPDSQKKILSGYVLFCKFEGQWYATSPLFDWPLLYLEKYNSLDVNLKAGRFKEIFLPDTVKIILNSQNIHDPLLQA